VKKAVPYISVVLLFVLALNILPAHVLHGLGGHEDTVCYFDPGKKEASLERTHTHCDIFETKTTVYDPPKVVEFEGPSLYFITELSFGYLSVVISDQGCRRSARAPPAC
jgi:hypothetical protein